MKADDSAQKQPGCSDTRPRAVARALPHSREALKARAFTGLFSSDTAVTPPTSFSPVPAGQAGNMDE